jgi:hypothetical protein
MELIKNITKPLALASAFMYASCTMAQPQPSHTQIEGAAGKGFALIELFTSEGCSSCPPADRLIEALQKDNPEAPLYILAYHVDYWDHQGWKDRFSDHAYTLRQQQYASWLNLETIYTPQMIVNGQKEHVGSNAAASEQAIQEALQTAPDDSLTLHATQKGDQLELHYQYNQATAGKAILVALVQKEATSQVTAGENTGRRLPHVQIVRQLKQLDSKNEGHAQLKTPADFNKEGWELIAFVQNKKDGKITAATKAIIQQ